MSEIFQILRPTSEINAENEVLKQQLLRQTQKLSALQTQMIKMTQLKLHAEKLLQQKTNQCLEISKIGITLSNKVLSLNQQLEELTKLNQELNQRINIINQSRNEKKQNQQEKKPNKVDGAAKLSLVLQEIYKQLHEQKNQEKTESTCRKGFIFHSQSLPGDKSNPSENLFRPKSLAGEEQSFDASIQFKFMMHDHLQNLMQKMREKGYSRLEIEKEIKLEKNKIIKLIENIEIQVQGNQEKKRSNTGFLRNMIPRIW